MLNLISSTLLASAIATSGVAPHEVKAASSCSTVSHYGVGDGYHGRITASGEKFNAYGLSTAHRNLPFGTKVLLTNPANGKQVTVRVNDRGPFVRGRVFDLSYGAFSQIAPPSQGVATVCYARI